jgi:hypothetical protein
VGFAAAGPAVQGEADGVTPAGFFFKGANDPFTIHASKAGETIETVLMGPTMSVAKARILSNLGWKITDPDGRVFRA